MTDFASVQLRKKMRYEGLFARDITRFFSSVSTWFLQNSSTRVSIDSVFHDRLKELLLNHYKRVSDDFGNTLRPQLPTDVRSTTDEDAVIRDRINTWNNIRAEVMSTVINNTTDRDIKTSIAIAQGVDTDSQEVVDGRVVSKKAALVGYELVLTASAILKRKFGSRVPTIANTETQASAESSGDVEADVLAALPESFSNVAVTINDTGLLTETELTDQELTEPFKTWVSLSNSDVRETQPHS